MMILHVVGLFEDDSAADVVAVVVAFLDFMDEGCVCERIAFALSSHDAVCATTALLPLDPTNALGKPLPLIIRPETATAAAADAACFLAASLCCNSSLLRHRRSSASSSF